MTAALDWFRERWIEPVDGFVVFDRNGKVSVMKRFDGYTYRLLPPNSWPHIVWKSSDGSLWYTAVLYMGNLMVSDLTKLRYSTDLCTEYLEELERRRQIVICLERSPVHCLTRLIAEFL